MIHNRLCTGSSLRTRNADRNKASILDTLCVGTQYPDVMVICWRINADIGEIEIERDENSFLYLRCAKHVWIRIASQLFGKHGMNVVSRLLK
jgi:hypothetical protein